MLGGVALSDLRVIIFITAPNQSDKEQILAYFDQIFGQALLVCYFQMMVRKLHADPSLLDGSISKTMRTPMLGHRVRDSSRNHTTRA